MSDLSSLIAGLTARRQPDTAPRRPGSSVPIGGGTPAVASSPRPEPKGGVPAGFRRHDIRDYSILGRVDILDYAEPVQRVIGSDVVVDPARGNIVVWDMDGTSGSLEVLSRPAVPSDQVLPGKSARLRSWSVTVFIRHGASGPKTLTLPGGLGAVPEDAEPITFSSVAGKIDIVTCTYVEGLDRWFTFVCGLGY